MNKIEYVSEDDLNKLIGRIMNYEECFNETETLENEKILQEKNNNSFFFIAGSYIYKYIYLYVDDEKIKYISKNNNIVTKKINNENLKKIKSLIENYLPNNDVYNDIKKVNKLYQDENIKNEIEIDKMFEIKINGLELKLFIPTAWDATLIVKLFELIDNDINTDR